MTMSLVAYKELVLFQTAVFFVKVLAEYIQKMRLEIKLVHLHPQQSRHHLQSFALVNVFVLVLLKTGSEQDSANLLSRRMPVSYLVFSAVDRKLWRMPNSSRTDIWSISLSSIFIPLFV